MSKQRRKGNAQGASSARAAELLQASGGIGFDALSLIPGLSVDVNEVTSLMDEIGLNVEPELRVIFKKLNKRDAQTREKAIKELTEELKSLASDQVKLKNAFPCFASGYPKLVTDCSPTVRSYSNIIAALFITTLKKDAGSQLKSVVPFLFFSKQDRYVAVANSATTAINECFPSEEKQQLAVDTFGGDVVAICLQILSKTHKLVAPQKFTEEETDVQRQTRLIAQSINTLESFIECAPGLFETIGPQFASSATFNSLMNMDPAVKAAAFRLLKKLVQKDVKLILGTRIPSYILQNLSAEDILLCRNVFECFLVAGSNPQFFEACKVDKAVIPRMLNLVRKKGLHWNVLEYSLLPSISLIYDNLNGAEREKWLKDVLISFFDDVEMGIPLSAWSKALSEALKFSFMKSAELSGSSFIEFLIEQVLRFIGIAISFGEKQPVDVVVDLLIWIPSKVETLNDAEFLEQISRKLLALLPRSIPILEKYIEDSNSFKIAVDLLKNNKCPDETFLKCFKLLDADAVDLKQFGNIVAARSIKCEAFAVQEKLLALLLELLEDGEIPGTFKDYIHDLTPEISWALIDVCNNDTFGLVDDWNRVAEVVVEDLLEGRMLVDITKLSEFVAERLDYDVKEKMIFQKVKEANEYLTMTNLLVLIQVCGKLKAELGKFLFGKLLDLFLLTEDVELSELEPFTVNFGPQLPVEVFQSLIERILDENFVVKEIIRIAHFVSSLSVTCEQVLDFLPKKEFVESWIQKFGSKYLMNLLVGEERQSLLPLAIHGTTNDDQSLGNISTAIRLALFYGSFAESSVDLFDKDESGIFCMTSVFLIAVEYAIRLKASDGMFSADGVEFKEYQSLLNVIDRVLQDKRFEYISFFTKIPAKPIEKFSFVAALNDFNKVEQRRHVELPSLSYENETESSLLEFIYEAEAVLKIPEDGVFYLQTFVEQHRQEFEEWMFNFGTTNVKEVVSCSLLKLFVSVIGKVELSPEIRDFMLCGHVCAMQSITDYLKQNKPSINCQLAAYHCLEMFFIYDSAVKREDSAIALEWTDFYRPAAVAHIISWFFEIIEHSHDFSTCFLNKVCKTFLSLKRPEFENVVISEKLLNSVQIPTILEINKSFPFVQLAIQLIFGNFEDPLKFVGITLLKEFILDLFEAEHKVDKEEWGDDGPSEEEIKQASTEKIKKLPILLDQALSAVEITVLQKLMFWDALIQFLAELDVLTRVKYTQQLPVHYSDHILTLIFELLPKQPEKHLKELTFKGRLDVKGLFSERFTFAAPFSTSFEHYVCNLFFRTCTTLPSIVREWYIGLPRSISGEIHDYVKKYLSPLLITREMNATSNISKGRLSITVMPAVHEIQASYRFDEATLLLQISLADDYPLSNPTVEAQRAIVNKDVLRKFLLQLMQFLNNQNGLMLDGILQWKRSIDNHIEGIDECTICMMTVSATNYSLPKVKCRTCKKKFHGGCLYKWFDSSNNPTCPLCRAPFYS